MRATLEGSTRPLFEAFDTALLDLDGVTYRGPKGIPSAPSALQAARTAGMTLVFVTNNSSRKPDEVARHLTSLGIEAKPDEVLTAPQVAAAVLEQRLAPGDKVLVIGGPALRDEVEARGLVAVDSASDGPVAVVQGWHPDVGWRQLAEASYAIRDGAYYLATGRDTTLPNERGIAPGNGALVQAVVTATGIEPDSSGKPAPRMFLEAAERASAATPLVIGDRLDTDIAGARAAGFPSLLVLTGVHTARDAILAPPEARPTFIGDDLDSLAMTHPSPEPENGAWRVGSATARVVDGRIRIEGEGGLDDVRAACVAAWDAADRGEGLHIESLVENGIK
ncbi:MAG: HAD-IIA family hydrolase [Demequinaceae bacterium]|nr:HAD-IIA family hydrolase [Demequinaceae bacterium]